MVLASGEGLRTARFSKPGWHWETCATSPHYAAAFSSLPSFPSVKNFFTPRKRRKQRITACPCLPNLSLKFECDGLRNVLFNAWLFRRERVSMKGQMDRQLWLNSRTLTIRAARAAPSLPNAGRDDFHGVPKFLCQKSGT